MINFEELQETIVPNFKGGEGDTIIRKYEDDKMKVLRVTLKPGCSIGLHTHVTNSEVVYIIAGQGVSVLDGKEEVLSSGQCSYCPKGSEHTIANRGTEDLVLLGVVPEQ